MPENDDPRRCLPLYNTLSFEGQNARPLEKTANAGLLFDKFCDHWSGRNGKTPWKPESPKKGKAVKHQFLESIAEHLKVCFDQENLDQYHSRRWALLHTQGGESKSFKTSWRFVSGLGMGHVLETGFVWHRILGVPYLPGSSVKGLMRAWGEKWGGAAQREVDRLFGPQADDEKDADTGALIVFDAIPKKRPILEVDIMNPHYAPYYEGKSKHPADYFSPVPIFFLTVVAGVSFKFALAPRHGYGKTEVDAGFSLLKEALENIGAGGKTAVGYGYFD